MVSYPITPIINHYLYEISGGDPVTMFTIGFGIFLLPVILTVVAVRVLGRQEQEDDTKKESL